MHAWLIKRKPENYYIQSILYGPHGYFTESQYDRNVRIASLYKGINGQIYPEISEITSTKDNDQTRYIYLGEVVEK